MSPPSSTARKEVPASVQAWRTPPQGRNYGGRDISVDSPLHQNPMLAPHEAKPMRGWHNPTSFSDVRPAFEASDPVDPAKSASHVPFTDGDEHFG